MSLLHFTCLTINTNNHPEAHSTFDDTLQTHHTNIYLASVTLKIVIYHFKMITSINSDREGFTLFSDYDKNAIKFCYMYNFVLLVVFMCIFSHCA